MFVYIKDPGLTFIFNGKEYNSPIEFEIHKNKIDDLLIQLRKYDIDNFIISPEKQNKKNNKKINIKTNTVNKQRQQNVIENNDNKQDLSKLENLLLQFSDKLKNIENKIDNQKITQNIVYTNDSIEQQNKKSKNDIDTFIPEIDLSGMDSEISNDIKIEKSEGNQENSADLLRKILGE